MKDFLWKLQPYLMGGLIGWLAIRPPGFTESWGPWRYLLMVCLAGLGVLGTVVLSALQSLPRDLRLQPLGRPLYDPEIQRLAECLHLLGFRQAGEPLQVQVKPPASLVPFTHPEVPAFATVFRTGTLPAKVSFDLVSVVTERRGALTTLNNPLAAVFPAAPGSLRQVFPGAAPERCFAEHRATLAGLAKQGLAFVQPDAGTVTDTLRFGSARQRQLFLQSPLRHSLVLLWRLWTRDNPHLGPVFGQRGAQGEIRKLLAGR